MNISSTIIDLATARGKDKTICPSEVARKLWPKDWRMYMEKIRQTAFQLRDAGKVAITQKGKEITENEITGPIRIRIV